MPLHFPHLGHHHHSDSDKDKSNSKEPDKFIPTSSGSPVSPNTVLPRVKSSDISPIGNDSGMPPARRTSTITSNSSSSTAPPSILRKVDSGSEYTGSSTSASAFLSKRLSGMGLGTGFDRSDTISSYQSDDREDDSSSTPATSVSSLGNQCPLPQTSIGQRFPFFMMTLSSTSTLSFIALPLAMRPMVLDAINRAWRKGIAKTSQVDYQPELMKRHKDKGCEGGVWEVTMKDNAWMPDSKDKVSSKRILINIMTVFAREGYALTSSFRTSAKDSGKDTLIFLRGEPDPNPIFFAVAFHSSDRVWIIDAEADVGEALEAGIRTWWLDGIRDARVRERHCREIRLRGSPWTSHSTSSLISARCIHLAIMKHITHTSRGYDFVGSVDMADVEEGEMPVCFYRRKWGASRAVWDFADGAAAAT